MVGTERQKTGQEACGEGHEDRARMDTHPLQPTPSRWLQTANLLRVALKFSFWWLGT